MADFSWSGAILSILIYMFIGSILSGLVFRMHKTYRVQLVPNYNGSEDDLLIVALMWPMFVLIGLILVMGAWMMKIIVLVGGEPAAKAVNDSTKRDPS